MGTKYGDKVDTPFCPEGLEKDTWPRTGSRGELVRLDRNVVPRQETSSPQMEIFCMTINTTIKILEKIGTAKPKPRLGIPKKRSVTNVTRLCLSVRHNLFESFAYQQRIWQLMVSLSVDQDAYINWLSKNLNSGY
ncbi:hypothetical protein PHYBLDRAFT_147087 [Phycomyces blakesleeanus NRRL 1555(-)]|uniref:Homeodomain-like DNA binding domain-containing transcription factor n=1 Tax=Phycomyces blakesleeanus (strain ATCC 8743b / DSM 1359 / FGSC 10004 / NBRC 33097 / NRRL 1555) TaxID=763407 RepID=A0A167M8G5_PHYB8|nr:hypothetical protein PHYBLDRAFT_147087 [Phycomyces blakesleeanus NRRL 1555(-)]OAD72109.1 hypothetical protein PHYBLDRAFT_147087 [Phycomyces blakesleeanus NRRL 1555(-)]|eukprot:XP_018290149.1 hypothetical protein PHYBLDRAFT_147087 [Phycomyces blakesleeanus NRRL 1555(-)]